MWPYNLFIGSIVILLVADSLAKKTRLGFFSLVAVLLTVAFVVCRDYVGYDYATYVEFFSYPINKLINRGLEWGYIGVSVVIHLFSDNYFWLFFIIGTTTVLLVCRGILLYTDNFRIAFLVYLLTPGLFLNSFSIIRQGLAIALLFNAYYYLYIKNIRFFFLYLIAAVSFHYTVLAALPFMLLASKVCSNARIFIIIGIPVSLFISQLHVIPNIIGLILGDTKFVAYADFMDNGTSLSKLIILNTIIVFYLFFINKLNHLNRILLVIVAIGLMLTNICADVAAITRIGYYFKIFDCVLIANIVQSIKNPNYRMLLVIMITMYYYALLFNALNVDIQLDSFPKLTPYRTIFD